MPELPDVAVYLEALEVRLRGAEFLAVRVLSRSSSVPSTRRLAP